MWLPRRGGRDRAPSGLGAGEGRHGLGGAALGLDAVFAEQAAQALDLVAER